MVSERIVIGISDGADTRLNACFNLALGVLDGDGLAAAIGVMDCVHAAPIANAPGISVDHVGNIDKADPGGDVGKVGDQQHVWYRRVELPAIERTRRRLVADRSTKRLATDRSLADPCPSAIVALCTGPHRSLRVRAGARPASAIDQEVPGEHARDLGPQGRVPLCAPRQSRRIGAAYDMIAVRGRGDRQVPADRLDPMRISVIVNGRDHVFRQSSSAIAR